MKHKINLVFEQLSLQRIIIGNIIKKCIHSTLDDSFIILDEAQNTTKEQMKMFLTRLGFGSKIVITGDVTQIDLPDDKTSGLKDAVRVLTDVDDIAICTLTSADVVRHALVQKIINAYEKADKKKEQKREQRKY